MNNELTVVHSNELVEAAYNLNIDEMRLIIMCASKVDSRLPNVGEIRIYPDEYAGVFGLSKSSVYKTLIKSVRNLANKSVTLNLSTEKEQVLPWLARGVYSRQPHDSSFVIIEFSKYIEPYIYELKNYFTVINFQYASRLNTPFSFRLYQWLIKYKNLESHKNEVGAIELDLTLEEMKQRANLVGSYERWDVFKTKVIDPAVEKINERTDISVSWKPLKEGKKVTGIKFFYVNERDSTRIKPSRPRLFRRPQVIKNSHAEGVWLRKNLSLLLNYEQALFDYDPKLKLSVSDLKKTIEIYEALGENLEIHDHYHTKLKELKDRVKA